MRPAALLFCTSLSAKYEHQCLSCSQLVVINALGDNSAMPSLTLSSRSRYCLFNLFIRVVTVITYEELLNAMSTKVT